jgi:DNA-binding GntR family transcriptional regulator
MLDESIRPPTLTSVVTNTIREAILSGELPLGSHLNEVELSNRIKVSRGTIRTALRELQDESIVDVIPYRGTYVTRLTKKKVEEIYTFRALIEPYAVRISLENNAYNKNDLTKLSDLVNELGHLEKNEGNNLRKIINTDMKFHFLLCERSGHKLITDVLKGLQVLTQLFILHTKIYHSDRLRDEASHSEIIEAIHTNDPVYAEQTVRKHIISAGSSLLEKME